MPFGYWRDINDHVFTTCYRQDRATPSSSTCSTSPILDGGIDTSNGHLVFRTRIGGVEKWGAVNVHSQPAAGVGGAGHGWATASMSHPHN